MLAYLDGSLCEAIHQRVVTDAHIKERFSALCKGIASLEGNKEAKANVLAFVLLHFVWIRGRWFLNSMRAERGQALESIDLSATRSKVASKAAMSKAAADATKVAADKWAFQMVASMLVNRLADVDDSSDVKDDGAVEGRNEDMEDEGDDDAFFE